MWILDFEASGLSKQSYPIEVGVTNGSQSFETLIQPFGSFKQHRALDDIFQYLQGAK